MSKKQFFTYPESFFKKQKKSETFCFCENLVTSVKKIHVHYSVFVVKTSKTSMKKNLKKAIDHLQMVLKSEGVSLKFTDKLPDKNVTKDTNQNRSRRPAVVVLENPENKALSRQSARVKSSSEYYIYRKKRINWQELAEQIISPPRVAVLKRTTAETDIKLKINLDGQGRYKIDSGLEFFNHMLEQLSKHSGVDIDLSVKGDLNVDEHHTIEDTAIALGSAFQEAVGSKVGLKRYGFMLPMDEVRALCTLDFSGRPEVVFKAVFNREYVGDFPTELTRHFFYSFAINAGLTMHLEITSGNEHHMIESAFKALGHALRQAIRREGEELLSTKKML